MENPIPPFSKTDKNYYFTGVAFGGGLLVASVEGFHGAVVLDSKLRILYQDDGFEGHSAGATDDLLGVGSTASILLYRVAAIRSLAAPCLDTSFPPPAQRPCDVRFGSIPAPGLAWDWSMAADLVAVSAVFFGRVQLFAPWHSTTEPVSEGRAGPFVELWEREDGRAVYLASFADGRLEIRDVTCAAIRQCPRLPEPIATLDGLEGQGLLTHSGGLLFVGGHPSGGSSSLIDVTDPERPRRIDPPGYLAHYEQYEDYRPLTIAVQGDRVLRAGYSLLDAHELVVPDLIFEDDFESGDTRRWLQQEGDGR